MKVLIISGGDLGDTTYIKDYIEKNALVWDLIICADSGARHLDKLGIRPDILVGDFDSLDPSLLETYRKTDVEVQFYSKDKDWTDTQIAVDIAIDRGADMVYLIGALGSRWDHSYGNVMLLYRMEQKGIRAKILHSNSTIEMTNDTLEIQGSIGEIVSLLPFSQEVLVESTCGLAYPLKNSLLTLDFPIGISNILVEEKAKVKVSRGWIMSVISKD